MKKLLFLILALVGVTGSYATVFYDDNSNVIPSYVAVNTTYVYAFSDVPEVPAHHCWWETGNYSSNIVARLVSDDERRIAHREIYAERNGTNSWILKQLVPKYTWNMTNQVHWMKAHVPEYTNTTAYIEVTAWHRWGWFNLYWKESLTDTKWEPVCSLSKQHSAINKYKIYMHPKSELTQRMLKSKTGIFTQSTGTVKQNGTVVTTCKIYSINLDNFFPPPPIREVIEYTVPDRINLGIDPVVDSFPPLPGVVVKTYWLNTNSGTRHNSSCRYYENTIDGVPCNEDDGTACKICGG